MDWLRLENTNIGYLCLSLLAVITACYLLSVRRKSRGTWWLTGVIVSLALSLVATLLDATLLPTLIDRGVVGSARPVLVALDDLLLALSAIAAVGFAYDLSSDGPTVGGRWAVWVGLAAVLSVGVLLALAALEVNVRPRPLTIGAHGVTGLMYLWAAAVFGRRALAAWGYPPSRRARALRGYGALMPLGAAVGVAAYAARFGGAPEVILWGLLLALLLGLLSLYVSYATEPLSLRAKVVALGFFVALAALGGAAALGIRFDDLARSSGAPPPERSVRLAPLSDGGYRTMPADAALDESGGHLDSASVWSGAEVDLGFPFPFGGRTWETMRVFPTGYVSFGLGSESPVIAPLYVPPSADGGAWDLAPVYVHREPGRAVVTWFPVLSSRAEEHAVFQLALDDVGGITIRYSEAGYLRSMTRAVLPRGPGGSPVRVQAPGPLPVTVPAEGVLQTVPAAYAAHTSRRLVPWVWLTLGVTAAVLLGLPLLLRTSVTRPLDQLLAGVRRVEDGDLSTEIAVEAQDEVGRLTGHFNRMTAALRAANADLRAYAETLETRVEERTAELAERNADLAAEKAALAEALDELHRAQAQLVQQEKLVALGRLTSGIAHEIKNPLNFVVNFSDLSRGLADDLLREAAADPERRLAEVREDLDDLRSNAERVSEHGRRADAIVRAMMDHARGGAESVRPVDLNGLIEEHVGLAVEGWAAAGAPAAEVVRAYDDAVGEVAVTPRGLGRVVVNLVSNALDAVAERGVTPAASGEPARIAIRTRRTAAGVEVIVEDDGVGIATPALSRLFEPFYTTKPTGQGHVGLGLSLARDVVLSHGGTLEVESVEGGGATFTVTLPDR